MSSCDKDPVSGNVLRKGFCGTNIRLKEITMKNKWQHMVFLVSTALLFAGVLSACSGTNETTPALPTPGSSKVTGTAGLSSPTPNESKIPTVKANQTPSVSSTTKIMKLKTISFVDKQGIGTEAFKILVPVDWKYEGGVIWVMDSPTMPAISQFRIWNPAGTEQFQVFPNQAFFWTDNPLTMELFPIGSKYFGSEVREPLSPVAALKAFVIPRFRSSVQDYKLVNEQDISDIVAAASAGVQSTLPTSKGAGKIRIEYSENGKTMEEEIYSVVEATYIPLQTIYGPKTNIMWGVNYTGSFKAEKGKLDTNAKILQTISDSVTLNLQWFNKYVQVVEYLIKMNIQQIQSTGQLGSIIAQTGSEIRQENLDLYNLREATNDRISSQFSEYVRGVDSYYNPLEEKNVELPTGYDNVWVNNSGEYILADNPNYNPNVDNNQSFQRLEKTKQ
jgi:hypothetical protein